METSSPMIRRMMEEVEAKKNQKDKSFVVFALFAYPAFIIERPIFQMYPGISLT
jgi:hypothetical protein